VLAQYREAMVSNDMPINPYRVYGELMQVLAPRRSFVTHEPGNTRDQLTTVYDTLMPRGFLGWGNVSSLGYRLGAVIAAKKAYPDRQVVAVTGEAGLGYMMGNLEMPVWEQLGMAVVHVSNGGFSGYGPDFWGKGNPYTHRVLGPNDIDLSKALREFGLHTERVTEPGNIAGALKRTLAANDPGQPASLEVVCCQFPVYGQGVRR
jgi:acetolactate synthase-1/2/3 large subunit